MSFLIRLSCSRIFASFLARSAMFGHFQKQVTVFACLYFLQSKSSSQSILSVGSIQHFPTPLLTQLSHSVPVGAFQPMMMLLRDFLILPPSSQRLPPALQFYIPASEPCSCTLVASNSHPPARSERPLLSHFWLGLRSAGLRGSDSRDRC